MGRDGVVKKIITILFDMLITVIVYGTFLWLAANLLFLAFHIGIYINYLQALAIDFFIIVILECFSYDSSREVKR